MTESDAIDRAILDYAARGDLPGQVRALRAAYPHLVTDIFKAARLQRYITIVARDYSDGRITIDEAIQRVADYAAKVRQ